jgi:2-furoate---CoA ligase
MFDLGTSFLASVERDGGANAVVDGETVLTYDEWFRRISAVVQGLDGLGVAKGDHIVTILQNTLEAATLHWACQFAGVIITPINWRATPDEVDFALENAGARALFFDESSADNARAAKGSGGLPLIACCDALLGETAFAELVSGTAPDASPMAGPEDWSLMLYTSGTTSAPKGVPRRHAAERAAAIAHVAQNLYPTGECTLGVMPLYHTMGVRSLLAMSLVNGCFVCLPRFDVRGALDMVARHRISSLYLVPTLYHDILANPVAAEANLSSVKRLGFAGAAMTDGLLKRVAERFRPELFVNHYGSSEIYTFTIDQNATAKPGSAGKAGLNQIIRVVPLEADDGDTVCAPDEEGQIIAKLTGDESFEGYWNRPDADEKGLKNGWYFTGDSGLFDADGDLFVTGRVDDMIITGGENVSPAEIESCLSLHPAVSECAVVGLPDERWGKAVTAFIKRTDPVTPENLDAHCKASGLANFKRPRRYEFVADIPKSPVGKLLRRFLVAGEYTSEEQEPKA